MNPQEVKTIIDLDTLAEYQSQRTLLELDKKTLLEDVRVPEEVQAIVAAGMKEASEVFISFTPEVEASIAQEKAELDTVVVPEEIKVAFAEIDTKRAAIRARYRAQDAQRRDKIAAQQAAIRTRVEEETKGVFTALVQRKTEIEAEFAGKEAAVDLNILHLTEEIKLEVKTIGFTVKGLFRQAVYVKGKRSWIPQRLDKYTDTHPDIKDCYTVGDPSVTIRDV